MGHAGKVEEQIRARELRAEAWTLQEIADELGVSKSSASLWCRDVEFTPKPRNRGHSGHKPHPLHVKKLAEIECCRVKAEQMIGALSERDLLMFCLALYAGEGSKTDGSVIFANSDPLLIAVFISWLRSFFKVDEKRLRMKIYLHSDLDLVAATRFWSEVSKIPVEQFRTPYRVNVGPTRRTNRHVNGCATVSYNCSLTHRRVMAMIAAVTSPFRIPG
jgi:transcriptional regulator with XRE-family HTH domain